MSFGSVLRASSMPSEKRQIFLSALETLSTYRIIWKWEKEEEVVNYQYYVAFVFRGRYCQPNTLLYLYTF